MQDITANPSPSDDISGSLTLEPFPPVSRTSDPSLTLHDRDQAAVSSIGPLATYTPDPYPQASNTWDQLGHSAHHAIIACVILGGIAVLFFAAWHFRPGRSRSRPSQSQDAGPAGAGAGAGILPLHHIRRPAARREAAREDGGQAGGFVSVGLPPGGDAPPPRYEEVVTAQHQRLAGGMAATSHVAEAEDGMVADGKTPLSEIPFEDVVLDHASSSQSSSSANRAFAEMHHSGPGDTTGHTNT
jgi:hypothetical protein